MDEIYAQMKAILPTDIDVSEGSHTWNLTRPTALVAAELCEFVLPQVIQLIFPETSYGEFLDAHATARGMTRKAPTAALGEITIKGVPGTVVPAGSVFSTASLNNEDPSISYTTIAQATVDSTGTVTTALQCMQTGTIGNTPANTIILSSSSNTRIESANNLQAVTGGTDEETDEELIARISEYDQMQGDSNIGNIADYKRWATSVEGVGSAVIIPANDDTGLVTIVVTNQNEEPASSELCTAVYNYIMSPDNPNNRLAPINANISVIAPQPISIGVKATVELSDEATIEGVKILLFNNLSQYLPQALADEELRMTRIGAILSATQGVIDFSGLEIGIKNGGTIEYGTSNIPIVATQLPTIAAEDITISEGTV